LACNGQLLLANLAPRYVSRIAKALRASAASTTLDYRLQHIGQFIATLEYDLPAMQSQDAEDNRGIE
jgi:hypothetical protein